MKTAVISGGNGGLGRALASGLQADGWHTVLLDLSIEGLQASDQQTPIACDLTDPDQHSAALTQILSERPTVDLVIYNAGITQIGATAELTEATLRKVFEVNFFAATNMARAFIAPLRASKGTHLAMSSVAGFSPLYQRAAYAASKHALEGYFSSLRSEEAEYGVKTLIAAPSFVATNTDETWQPDGTGRPGAAKDGIDHMSPDEAATIILQGVQRETPFIPVGRIARLSHLIHRVSPRLFQRLMEKNIKGH
ncbi:Short-chain dehydrogenase [Shimia gijangensis]|uniref:Short-chain dehydrogenase n=1 Tax=Shimia gijangensis TaxID=1470563 RepID=A0A1M6J737_9RHOB|nr:SDR family NAD(P)-dependent oxidoreductase [Shimia gijangensis]SHJ42508.1 Short-chain dehydrogenase [Shimia gijangensis]